MHCKNCDYPLWNLKARECPECGSPFKPSDFEFVLNSVRFCCPTCSQAYYGTGAKGHLVPTSFTCVTCGQPVEMDSMVLLPAEGVAEEQTKTHVMPWLKRQQGGWIRAWFSTVGMAMVRPAMMMRAVPLESSVIPAWLFFLVTQVVVTLVFMIPMIMLFAVIGLIASNTPRGGGGFAQVLGPIAGMMALGAVGLVFTVVLTMIWGLLTHGVLRLTGQTRAPMGRTFQALCYSSGASIFTATPCVGPYFGWIWWVVSAVLAVKEGQQVSGGRAALAVLPAPLLVVLSVVGGYAAIMYFALSSVGTAGTVQIAPGVKLAPAAEVQPVADGLLSHVQLTGHWPVHGTALLVDGRDAVDATDFVLSASSTRGESVPVAFGKLYDFGVSGESDMMRLVQAAAEALPEDVVAHRVGDVVFTYHGVKPEGDGRLWIFIAWPDPRMNVLPQPWQFIAVALSDGTVEEIGVRDFDERLEEQNVVRATEGLPPLPHPSIVTHDSPARR